MARKHYKKNVPGSTALLLAALHLRRLARLEFLYDLNSEEGIFLSHLALDLRKIADGGSPRGTAMWRAIAEQFPKLFAQRSAACHIRLQDRSLTPRRAR